MAFWRRGKEDTTVSLDEFVGDGEARAASPLELKPQDRDWQARLSRLPAPVKSASELSLPAFTLIRDGDMFETSGRKAVKSPPALLDTYFDERLRFSKKGVGSAELKLAQEGLRSVLAGNPAIVKRMLLARPIEVFVIPRGHDYREFGFPPNTNPRAAGIFFNQKKGETAMLGLREEHLTKRPWLAVHEMAHAVHFLGLTERERKDIDKMLRPVYRSSVWIEEAFAIYAERTFGAEYDADDLRAPGLYGKTRRDWDPKHVFSLFVQALFRPADVAPSKPSHPGGKFV